MKKSFYLSLLFFCCLSITTWAQYDVSSWKSRDQWQKVPELLKALNLKPGAKVADVGCHKGYMTMHLAKKVGKTGKVYAVDLDNYKLVALDEEAKKRGFSQIKTIQGKPNDPLLPTATLDAVIMIDTYHEVAKPIKFLKKLKKALKPGGRIVIVETIRTYRKHLSRKEQLEKHNLDIGFVRFDFKKAGLSLGVSAYPFTKYKNKETHWMWYLAGIKPNKGI
ncbi:MAG TPA: methyltransferase type 11 [Microscillaceae bacterium]|nr:methyltransferase type 11 [Microscillaceae bacterium]